MKINGIVCGKQVGVGGKGNLCECGSGMWGGGDLIGLGGAVVEGGGMEGETPGFSLTLVVGESQ